jgi:hypothetical protein
LFVDIVDKYCTLFAFSKSSGIIDLVFKFIKGAIFMKRKSIVAALMVCAALLVPTMAMAAVKTAPAPAKEKKIIRAVTVTPKMVNEGCTSVCFPQVAIPENKAAGERINALMEEELNNFLKPVEHAHRYGSGIASVDKNIDNAKITGDVNYEVMCNDKTIFSVILNEKIMTPHKDGKVYTGLFKKAMNFNTEGKAISSKEWSKVAKVVNCADPFSKANLKKAVEENAKAHNYILPKDYEESLLEARDNYYVDSTLGLHALYAPGTVAAESAGWIDIKIG